MSPVPAIPSLEVFQELLLLYYGHFDDLALAHIRQLYMCNIHAAGYGQLVLVVEIPARKLSWIVFLYSAHQRAAKVEDANNGFRLQVAKGDELAVAARLSRVGTHIRIREDVDLLYVFGQKIVRSLLTRHREGELVIRGIHVVGHHQE